MNFHINKKNLAILMIISMLSSLVFSSIPQAQAATTITVTTTTTHNPGYYWCQNNIEERKWSSDSTITGKITVNNDGGQPAKTLVTTGVTTIIPTTDWKYKDFPNTPVSYSNITNVKRVGVVMADFADPALEGNPYISGNEVYIQGYSGKGVYGFSDDSICGDFNGMIYPFPVVVTYEGTYTINDGTAIINHFTESGQSLSSIFPDRQETLVNNQPYSYSHPTNSNYEYVGHKKSTTGTEPSGGSIIDGDPPMFTYNSSFPTYYLFYYYRLKQGGTPVYNITGDFDILPSSTIDFRDSFSLKPKNIVIPNGCTYSYHEYQISRDGSTWTSGRINGQNTTSTYSYSSYPFVIGVGSHNVSIRITASCASSGWSADKTLTVNDKGGNNPPVFSVGWTTVGQWTSSAVKTSVAVGTQLDLVYLDSPAASDPDGDSIQFLGFDLAGNDNSWVRGISSRHSSNQYDNGWHRITMDTAGNYCVVGTMRDQFGLSASRTACITVVPANPIPVITGSTEVVEGRTLAIPLSSSNSYSPVNRSINHALDVWTNKKNIYTAVGTEIVTLDVFDSTGLKSLSPATHRITVKPDKPPIAVLNTQNLAIRDTSIDIYNNSYSEDGDRIVAASYRYKHDRNINGFNDDTWVNMTGTLTKTSLTPAKVGKYLIEITVTEDFGKTGSGTIEIDTVNQAPSVSFLMEGENEQPAPSNKETYNANTVMNSWNLYKTNTNTPITTKTMAWTANGQTLSAGLGRSATTHRSYYMSYSSWGSTIYQSWVDPMQDDGYGSNNLNGYRAIQSGPYSSQPLLFPENNSGPAAPLKYVEVKMDRGFFMRTNKSHFYYQVEEPTGTGWGESLVAMNKSKIGGYNFSIDCPNNYCASKHSYVGDSPIDFVIGGYTLNPLNVRPTIKVSRSFPNRQAMLDGDLTGINPNAITTVLNPSYKILGYEVSDSTIYQFVKWTGGAASYVGTSETSTYEVWDLRTYDAFTGELIQSTAASGKPLNSILRSLAQVYNNPQSRNVYSQGDNIFYVNRVYNPIQKYTAVEFNRNGDIVSNKTFAESFTWNGCPADYQFANAYKGLDGEWYGYGIVRCPSSTLIKASFVYRINPDFTVAWTSFLQGRDPTPANTYTSQWGDPTDGRFVLLVNPITKEIVVRSYSPDGYASNPFYQVFNTDTGTLLYNFDDITYNYSSMYTNIGMRWDGSLNTNSGTHTIDGYRSTRIAGTDIWIYNASNQLVTSFRGGGTVRLEGSVVRGTGNILGSTYIGDGISLLFYQQGGGGSMLTNNFVPWIVKGTPTTVTAPYQSEAYRLGQFVSTDDTESSELTWNMKLIKPTDDTELAGFSFRMTDPRNRYTLETNGSTLYLSKYVNGTRTVLTSAAFNFQPRVNYAMKVSVQGSQIKAFVNGVPYLEATDSVFTSGKFGPFTNKSYVDFSNITKTKLSEPNVEWSTNYAIWESGSETATVRYNNIVFTDPENDPRAGNNQWSIEHTPKFLNNQGLSARHGQSFTSPILTFDKVGNYRVKLKAQDDPNADYLYPSTVFDSYRKLSNEFWQIITVHRRPVAVYTTSISTSNHNVIWTDTSYDPDRWVSASNYSTENTGINYQTTRGVLERQYYYRTPSGTTVNQKLVTPTEVGTYSIGLRVKDEYGAWSEWNEQQITIAAAVAPNLPPTPGFNLNKTTMNLSEVLSITSTARDPEDGAAANILHEYYIRNVTEGSAETLQSTSRETWTKSFSSLGVMEIRQVVTDSKGVSAQITKTVTVLNRAPIANFDWTPKPVWEGDTVTITNQSTDADGDALTYNWNISGPGGYSQTAATTNVVRMFSQPGDYIVTLTVSDGIAQTNLTRTIRSQPLLLEADVSHTELWLEHHLQLGHETVVPPKSFYTGEIFVVSAVGSLASTKKVTASLDATGRDGKSIAISIELVSSNLSNVYQGELYDPILSSLTGGLSNGQYQIQFEMEYTNGVVKQLNIPIQIIGHVSGALNVHRRQ